MVLRAEVGCSPLVESSGDFVVPKTLPLSSRVLVALQDWSDFFDDVNGTMNDQDVLDEFVGQGFKLAHGIRRELKGSTVWFEHPVTGERSLIELRAPR